ncbi:MAG: serine hydrolase [Nocardioidaceae bacterium]
MTDTAQPPAQTDPAGGGRDAVTLDNWQDPPFNRWGLSHVTELVTTAEVSRHSRAWATSFVRPEPSPLVRDLVPDDFLAETFTEAFLVMRGEEVLDERYLEGAQPTDRHLLMSVSKSLCGLLVGRLVGQSLIDPEATISTYVPELSGGGYGDATIQQVLDMTASIDYVEDYHNPAAHVHQQDRVAGWRPRYDDDPADTYEFLTTLGPAGRHGLAFQYCSASTDVLAWVVERCTGQRYADVLGSELWAHLGCADDAAITVDSGGFAFANGGVTCTARDLALVGRLVLDGGAARGEQVVPRAWVDATLAGGDPAVAAGSIFQSIHDGGSYRNQWWITGDERGSVFGTGIHGQYLWLDPTSDVVIVKFSSMPVAVSEESSRKHASAFRRLTEALG